MLPLRWIRDLFGLATIVSSKELNIIAMEHTFFRIITIRRQGNLGWTL